MIDVDFSTVTALMSAFGLPMLVAVFLLKGAFIGKVIPASIVLPAYIVAFSPDLGMALAVAALCSASSIVGEAFVYSRVKKHGMDSLNAVPRIEIPDERVDRVSEWFDHYGGIAIFGGSIIPGIRGFIIIPPALAAYPQPRAVVASFCGHYIYHSFLVLAALGIVEYAPV